MTKDDRLEEEDGGPIAELDELRRGVDPPGALEERTVRALRQEGLIRDRKAARARAARVAGAMAASVALFTIGVAAGRLTAPAAPEPGSGTFALLLRSGDSPEPVDEQGEAALVAEYAEWAGTIAGAGRLVDGQKLDDESRLLRRGAGGLEAQTAFMTREPRAVQGYFLVQADGYEDAVRIAGGCPHLDYGGSIEIRRIDPTP
jgi:hypothetical protein